MQCPETSEADLQAAGLADPDGWFADVGLQPWATSDALRRAFRAALLAAHPDKAPLHAADGAPPPVTPETLQQRRGILLNPLARATYHAHGGATALQGVLPPTPAVHVTTSVEVSLQALAQGGSADVSVRRLVRGHLSTVARRVAWSPGTPAGHHVVLRDQGHVKEAPHPLTGRSVAWTGHAVVRLVARPHRAALRAADAPDDDGAAAATTDTAATDAPHLEMRGMGPHLVATITGGHPLRWMLGSPLTVHHPDGCAPLRVFPKGADAAAGDALVPFAPAQVVRGAGLAPDGDMFLLLPALRACMVEGTDAAAAAPRIPLGASTAICARNGWTPPVDAEARVDAASAPFATLFRAPAADAGAPAAPVPLTCEAVPWATYVARAREEEERLADNTRAAGIPMPVFRCTPTEDGPATQALAQRGAAAAVHGATEGVSECTQQ